MKFETHVARLLPFDVTLHDFQIGFVREMMEVIAIRTRYGENSY